MKILLLSMPDVAPVIMHESAFHMPNLGIASIGANIDDGHEVYVVDLVRKRLGLRKHLVRILKAVAIGAAFGNGTVRGLRCTPFTRNS